MYSTISCLAADRRGYCAPKTCSTLRLPKNAVKTQIWIAISVYVLVAIMKKQLRLQESLYTILQILSVTAFEKNIDYSVDYGTRLQNQRDACLQTAKIIRITTGL
jgi:hypothetical protein